MSQILWQNTWMLWLEFPWLCVGFRFMCWVLICHDLFNVSPVARHWPHASCIFTSATEALKVRLFTTTVVILIGYYFRDFPTKVGGRVSLGYKAGLHRILSSESPAKFIPHLIGNQGWFLSPMLQILFCSELTMSVYSHAS